MNGCILAGIITRIYRIFTVPGQTYIAPDRLGNTAQRFFPSRKTKAYSVDMSRYSVPLRAQRASHIIAAAHGWEKIFVSSRS